jgi:RNA polymerase sigma-70 factor (ECF subfamily)
VQNVSDSELVARLKANDDAAYQEVIDRFGDPLYGYIYSIIGDHHLSQDVLSETYLRMVEKIDNYVFSGAPFKAWLYRIAHNLALNVLRGDRRLVGVEDLERHARPVTDPALRIEAQLDAAVVREALLELTEEQQQVLLLRFVGGLRPGEVALALGKSENAVKQMQFRALQSLRRVMERRGVQ